MISQSPFSLSDDTAYKKWREEKLRHKNIALSDLLVSIDDPCRVSTDEQAAILLRCEQYNMALFQFTDPDVTDKSVIHAFGKQLNMKNLDANLRSDEDSVSSLEVRDQVGNQYIPYTNKALSWHTDGYYNSLDKQIHGIIMYCVRPAAEGGINSLLNPEYVYITLRDENPAYIEALMHPEAMTIPDNIESGEVIRAAQSGPVFMVKAPVGESLVGEETGRLHMRYSARKRNIIWRDTRETKQAVEIMHALMADENNVFKVTLKAGQGIVCNNVLHNRSGFENSESQQRLLYRARYYDAVG